MSDTATWAADVEAELARLEVRRAGPVSDQATAARSAAVAGVDRASNELAPEARRRFGLVSGAEGGARSAAFSAADRASSGLLDPRTQDPAEPTR
ncbi:hypothetical protein AB0B28_12605 [Glycomyces sp. NPDC046736]|uniref:hypothetical protein n=1 Tax=Glycomyces sp. NPDC046736 TaxID=3155615 RepID=UPI0033CBA1AF